MEKMEKVQVPTAPGRLINAVANIGYDPEVALCDLMDNSVDADARWIRVQLVTEIHEEEGETDTIHQYIIADNGIGMERETLINAFTLGARREYRPRSLGKFGLGLKSAGLALGNQITIVTRAASVAEPLCAILSLKEVEESGEYRIDLGAPPEEARQIWDKYGPGDSPGTVVILSQLNENQPAYSAFRDYVRRYCSMIYHMFISDPEKPLSIFVNDQRREAFDPLFAKEAKENGALDLQAWDGRTAHMLLDDTVLDLEGVAQAVVASTHLIHPPSFDPEGKRDEMRDRYAIEADPYTRRPRHGFYVYRNRRVIVMAERFHGLVSSQVSAWAFRARLMFDENADRVLSLDVKKRHCQLPKRARSTLRSMISTYQAKSVEAWKTAGTRERERKRTTKEDKANESIAQAPVVDLGYAPGTDLSNEALIATRKQRQQEIAAETGRSIQDRRVSEKDLEKRAADKSVVTFVEGLKANAMWLPYPAVQLGMAETIVNKAHSWVAEAYAAAENEPGIAIVLHQLFTILARAELEVRSTPWSDLPADAIDRALERFRRKVSAIGEDLAETLARALGDDVAGGGESSE